MALIRARQRALTGVSPHQGNRRVIVPSRKLGGGEPRPLSATAVITPSSLSAGDTATLNVYGAGDAKFLMVQFGLFPTLPFATLMAICIILLQTPILIWRKGILRFGRETFSRLATLRIFPTREEFEEGKEPSTWIFVPAGIIYIWLFW